MSKIPEKKISPSGRSRPRVQVLFDDPSLTQQQFKDDCDLSIILDRYTRTGELPNSNKQGSYLDLASMPDYLEARNLVIQAQDSFQQLPAALRERFKNDPAQYLHFCEDPTNLPEMVKLGLAVERIAQVEPDSSPVPKNSKPGSSQALPAVGEGPKA